MNDFQKFLQQNYPNSNNNDANTVALLVRAGQEFAIVQKIEILKKIKKDLELNYDLTGLVDLDYEIKKLQSALARV